VRETKSGGALHEGVWLPREERHLRELMRPGERHFARLPDGRAAYQRRKYLAAMAFVAEPAHFVDVGAHVGLWSMQAEQDFERVTAFEPVDAHAALFTMNVYRARLYRVALGAARDEVEMVTPETSTGDTFVGGPGTTPMRMLDDFTFERIDLLKIDVEGYELPVCAGAVRTLKRCKPVIVIEQKGHDAGRHGFEAGAAAAFLRDLGAADLCKEMGGDRIMGWV